MKVPMKIKHVDGAKSWKDFFCPMNSSFAEMDLNFNRAALDETILDLKDLDLDTQLMEFIKRFPFEVKLYPEVVINVVYANFPRFTIHLLQDGFALQVNFEDDFVSLNDPMNGSFAEILDKPFDYGLVHEIIMVKTSSELIATITKLLQPIDNWLQSRCHHGTPSCCN